MSIQAGQTLAARSLCDHECIFVIHILSRKGQFVTLKYHDKVKRKKVHVDYDGTEYVLALGSYSMAPMFRAAR